jgi:hypothetical protein
MGKTERAMLLYEKLARTEGKEAEAAREKLRLIE